MLLYTFLPSNNKMTSRHRLFVLVRQSAAEALSARLSALTNMVDGHRQ